MIIWDNFRQFCIKTYGIETVQMRGHTIWFKREIRKIVLQLSSNTRWVDGWMTRDLGPFQQYFSHIRMMRG